MQQQQQQQPIVIPSRIEVTFVMNQQDKKLSDQIFEIFQQHQIDNNDQFMIKICVFILTWRRVMNTKKSYYSSKEENLWKRIYQGLTIDTSALGPVTEDLLPEGLEPDGSFWHILQAFTGDTHMNEFLGLTIDILYSLLACARPSIVRPYLTESTELQVTPNTQEQSKEQYEAQKETSSSSLPSQQESGKTVPFDSSTNIPSQRDQDLTPINEEEEMKKESHNEFSTSSDEASPCIPSTSEPIDNTKSTASSKQQKEKDVDNPTESSSSSPIIITTAKDNNKQYDDKNTTKKEEKQQQETVTNIPTSTRNKKEKEPMVIDQSTNIQYCVDKFMRASRTLLSEMIIQYQQVTDQKEASMLDTNKDLVQHVAQLLDDFDKEESQKTLATQIFYKMIKRYAQDDTGQNHVDSLISSLAKIKLDPKHKVHIINIWNELIILCQKERERKMDQLDQMDIEETSTSIKKQQEHDETYMIQPDIMNKVNSLLHSISDLILLHDKHVMEVLHHAGAIIMPYSGGFSHTLTYSAKQITLDIFWDSKRHCPTFEKEKWSNLKRVFSPLCELFGDFHIGHLEATLDNYDVILDNIQVNLKNAFPKYVHHEIQSKVEQATDENQLRAGESVDQSFDIASYFFKNMNVDLHGDYLYKKKTGFPIYMDYGKFHAIVQDIELKIQIITSFKEKSLIVKKSECIINKMNLQFDETQHKLLNILQKKSFERKIIQILEENIIKIIQHMILQLELALPN